MKSKTKWRKQRKERAKTSRHRKKNKRNADNKQTSAQTDKQMRTHLRETEDVFQSLSWE